MITGICAVFSTAEGKGTDTEETAPPTTEAVTGVAIHETEKTNEAGDSCGKAARPSAWSSGGDRKKCLPPPPPPPPPQCESRSEAGQEETQVSQQNQTQASDLGCDDNLEKELA